MERVREVLDAVRDGSVSVDEALTALKWAPFEDLGFARVDTHRRFRTGVPEVVYCAGKTVDQVVAIVEALRARHAFVLATRVTPEQREAVLQRFPETVSHDLARVLEIRNEPQPEHSEETPYVLVISAGTSDLPVAEEAAVTAAALGSRVERLYDCGVAGLHRLLSARETLDRARVIIVVAGMEGALPSVVGGLVEQPVIAVPTSVGYGAAFQGLAALLGMLNSCATGVTVVNIDNGFGAGYFAHLVNQIGVPEAGSTVESSG
ncbi:MAG: nickel pincer cofactor biosynthesis protein LarB [Armatimonadota bacterium]